MNALLLTGLLLSAAPHRYAPAEAEQLAHAAAEAYGKGDHEAAAEGWQRLVDDGWATADVLYDLGTAHLAANHPGRAVLFLERARRLAPDDADVLAHLEKARRGLLDKVEGVQQPPMSERIAALARPGTVALLFTVAWLLLWGALAIRRFASGGGWTLALALGGLAVVLPTSALLGLQAWVDTTRREAVVIAATLKVREGPLPSTKVRFELHEGTVVREAEQQGDWVRLRLRNGEEGWAELTGLERI